MAESLTVTMTAPFADGKQDNKIILSWTSAAGGTVSQNIAAVFAAAQAPNGPKPSKIKGYLVRAVTNPDDTDAPTDDYDITLLDSDGVDVAASELLNRDTANSEEVVFALPPYIDSEIILTIANAGNTKKGVLTLFIEGSSNV